MRTTLICFLLIAFFGKLKGQEDKPDRPLQINIIIDADNEIMVGEKSVKLADLETATRKITNRNKKYKDLVYKIYADETLKLGDIMDVEKKLFNWKSANIQRYLLKVDKIPLDGQNWSEGLRKIQIHRS